MKKFLKFFGILLLLILFIGLVPGILLYLNYIEYLSNDATVIGLLIHSISFPATKTEGIEKQLKKIVNILNDRKRILERYE